MCVAIVSTGAAVCSTTGAVCQAERSAARAEFRLGDMDWLHLGLGLKLLEARIRCLRMATMQRSVCGVAEANDGNARPGGRTAKCGRTLDVEDGRVQAHRQRGFFFLCQYLG